MNAIDKFIENWKKEIKKFYIRIKDEYNNDDKNNYESFAKQLICDLFTAKQVAYDNKYGKSNMTIALRRFNDIDKIIERDAKNRKEKLIAKVEKKAGKIIDADCLCFGVDGGINGYIQGEKKNVEVRTIYAGGYSIQCLHYRVLVK